MSHPYPPFAPDPSSPAKFWVRWWWRHLLAQRAGMGWLECWPSLFWCDWWRTLIKKKIKFSSYNEIKRDRVQSHIWLTASSYMGKNLRISSYMRKVFLIYDPIPSEFPYIWGKFCFLFFSVWLIISSAGADRSSQLSWPSQTRRYGIPSVASMAVLKMPASPPLLYPASKLD
jgi:hypothetical protein